MNLKYDSNGNQVWAASHSMWGNAIAVDSSGNVYIAGSGTIKFDPNGNQLWEKCYNDDANIPNEAYALVLDSSGNVCITGWIYDYATDNEDYLTIKYDSDGNQLWAARYNGNGNYVDEAYGLGIDGLGNVYVTGESYGSGTDYDYATIKYDPNGNQLWVERYNGDANGEDIASALAVDNSGNVYVTGIGGVGDYTTIKYDTYGNKIWTAKYNGDANGVDWGNAIAMDGQGNIYVTGYSYGSGTYRDYATVKYDPNGNQLWASRYNGDSNSWDEAIAIKVDGSGNVYVTGISWGNKTYEDYATVKYDPNGNQVWAARYGGPGRDEEDKINAMAVDGQGNVCITGSSCYGDPSYGGNTDYATIKYGPDGNRLWLRRYNGTGNGNDVANAIAVDNFGNVYVTGGSYTGSTSDSDYATIKYDPNGNLLWTALYNGDANGPDAASAIALDNSGNVYAAGKKYIIGKSIGTTIKYDPNGNQLWAAECNEPNNVGSCLYDIAVDSLGNVYVTGTNYLWLSCGQPTSYELMTIKYDPNGNWLWGTLYKPVTSAGGLAYALAVDISGNVYVTGFISSGGVYGQDYATIKYDPNGNRLWAAQYNGSGNNSDQARALALDNSGNVYVTGLSAGSGTGYDYATIKYDPNGNQLWVARYNGDGNSSDRAYAIALDESNNVYVTGYSTGSGTGYDYVTIKYDTNGNQLWVKRSNGPQNKGDYATELAIDNAGNVYVAGYADYGSGTTDYDYTTIKYTQHGYCITNVVPVSGDLNDDCKVNFVDYAIMANNWTGDNLDDLSILVNNWLEHCTDTLAGDFNGDCKINFADYVILAEDWLEGKDWLDLALLTDKWLDCNFALLEDCL